MVRLCHRLLIATRVQTQVALVPWVVEGIQSVEAEQARLVGENLAILQRTTKCRHMIRASIAQLPSSISYEEIEQLLGIHMRNREVPPVHVSESEVADLHEAITKGDTLGLTTTNEKVVSRTGPCDQGAILLDDQRCLAFGMRDGEHSVKFAHPPELAELDETISDLHLLQVARRNVPGLAIVPTVFRRRVVGEGSSVDRPI